MEQTVFVLHTVEHGIESVATDRAAAQRQYEQLKTLAAYKNINVLVDEFVVQS